MSVLTSETENRDLRTKHRDTAECECKRVLALLGVAEHLRSNAKGWIRGVGWV